MTTHRITLGNQDRRKDFDAQVKAVKLAGARFDPTTKTWTLDLPEGDDPLDYGLLTSVTYYGMTIAAE